jgi:hypothetical protein
MTRTILGFTGTRKGMTPEQERTVRDLIQGLSLQSAHHGACHGADRQFHRLVLERAMHVGLWPSNDEQLAWARQAAGISNKVYVHQTFPPLTRNRMVVERVVQMCATPSTMREKQRSGTWATIRYSRNIGRPVAICWPDGTVTHE